MKKFLLIPILLIAGAISASACGSCAAHSDADATDGAADCAKSSCDKEAGSADCAKDADDASASKKACCPSS